MSPFSHAREPASSQAACRLTRNVLAIMQQSNSARIAAFRDHFPSHWLYATVAPMLLDNGSFQST
jgi:hypothetical protein